MNNTDPRWYTDEHRIFRDSIQKFFQKELTPNLPSWRKQGFVDQEFWRTAGAAGMLSTGIPEQYGGVGADLGFEAIIAQEQMAVGDNCWAWSIHSICSHYIMAFGNEQQKARWLPKLADGSYIPALCMSEPIAGSDLQALKTYAKEDSDGFKLNGAKTFISNGQTANFLIVAAKMSNSKRSTNLSLFVVETDKADGFERGKKLEKIGLPGQDTSELFFNDVFVPKENILGQMGQGFRHLMEQLPWERMIIALGAVGYSELMMRETVEYVKNRHAFKKRLMDFQNTRFKLAECQTKLEVTRAFVHQCLEQLLEGSLSNASASMAKWWAAQVQCEIADECLQLHGGYGYIMEYPIAHAYADARIQQIYGGSREIMKELIARSMDA